MQPPHTKRSHRQRARNRGRSQRSDVNVTAGARAGLAVLPPRTVTRLASSDARWLEAFTGDRLESAPSSVRVSEVSARNVTRPGAECERPGSGNERVLGETLRHPCVAPPRRATERPLANPPMTTAAGSSRYTSRRRTPPTRGQTQQPRRREALLIETSRRARRDRTASLCGPPVRRTVRPQPLATRPAWSRAPPIACQALGSRTCRGTAAKRDSAVECCIHT